MALAKVEVENFNGSGDYMLCKEKLMAHLEIMGLTNAIDIESVKDDKKKRILDP